ncbi:MAG: hypothetical protein IPG68_09050 [Micrococcales bacterium]|nr:hypothetical protein [Micrococcales bacterium]
MQQLDVFIEQTAPINNSGVFHFSATGRPSVSRENVLGQWVIVKRVLAEVYPDWQQHEHGSKSYEFRAQRDAAIAARSMIARRAEIEENLKPSGPQLAAEQFRPWVWTDAVRTRWARAGYDDAVLAASRDLNEQLRLLARRDDLGEVKLIQDLLGEAEPNPGQVRLRPPADLDADTRTSLRRGTMDLGRACFMLARNPRAHRTEETGVQEALEHLAMMSAFARSIEQFEVALG